MGWDALELYCHVLPVLRSVGCVVPVFGIQKRSLMHCTALDEC